MRKRILGIFLCLMLTAGMLATTASAGSVFPDVSDDADYAWAAELTKDMGVFAGDSNGNFNEFAEVEALDTPITDDGKKFASTKLKIGAKLSFKGFIEICVDFVLKKTKLDKKL